MKKLFPLLLALVLIFSLAACAQKVPAASASAPAASSAAPASASAAAPASASAADSAKPATQKVLKVGMECAYAPYNWTQSDNSNGAVPIADSKDFANGYDVMIAKSLCDKLGYKLEIHKIDWDGLPMAVQAGTIDCAIDGISITAERQQTMDFSAPYYYANLVCLVLNNSKYASATGLSGLSGASATSQISTVWYDKFVPQIPNVNKLPAMDATGAMFAALQSKKCDVLVVDKPTALGAVAVNKDMKMLDFTANTADNFKFSDEDVNEGIECKKGNTELVNALNSILKNMTKDDFAKIMDDAIKVQPLSQ